MGVADKLQSIRQTVGVNYTKPDPDLVAVYKTALRDNKEATEYLVKERGFSNDTIEHFNLGYCADKDAISIPIYKNKELINIKYRILNPTNAKYLSETGAETWLFNEDGLVKAKEKNRILIVEGEFDAMMCWQNGMTAVISPATGKDSYGIWLEQLDPIKHVYIAYDNDRGGQETAIKMSQRVGEEKSLLVKYPDGVKDANEFFLSHTRKEFNLLVKEATPFYKNTFKSLGDIINRLRNNEVNIIKTKFLPNVELREGWLGIISGYSNVGKTSFVLNMANDFTEQGIPTLVLPFERGIESVGERFLHVLSRKSPEDFRLMDDEGWSKVIEDTVDRDLYFSLPNKEDTYDVIAQSKRILNTKVVIIDHLDYMVRSVRGSREEAISNTLQGLKRLAEDAGIVLLIVTHLRKKDSSGAIASTSRPFLEELKGSSSLYQDPEFVVMLSETQNLNEILVDVVKNKGEMTEQCFEFIKATGQFNSDYKPFEQLDDDVINADIWNA